jgi:transcriptional regulator with XRE-family HTH domain
MDLGKELKIWRLKHGLSKRTLAQMLGVSVPTLTRWEEGQVEPHDYHLHKLREFLEKAAKNELLSCP